MKSPRSLLGSQLHNVFVVLFFFSQNNAKVAVLGASGGIGQPLSLLLKNSPLVSKLSLYDIAHTPGVAADLSHIETRASVKGTWAWPDFPRDPPKGLPPTLSAHCSAGEIFTH